MKTWSIIINKNNDILKMMSDALSIYDQALYYQRQSYFETREQGKIKTHSFVELYNLVKETQAFKESKLDSVLKSASIRKVCNNWLSFIKSTISYNKNKNKFKARPNMPKYLHKHKKYDNVYIDKTRLRYRGIKRENEFRLPCTNIKIKFPPKIKREQIRQVVLQYYYGKIKVNIIYDDVKKLEKQPDYKSAIGIDLGVNNLCAITSNDKNLSCIVKGGPLKSINQYYNKKLAKISSNLEKCNKKRTSHLKDSITLKRNNKINNYMHVVSRRLIDFCSENGIGKIIIGHNSGWKQETNVGKKNNQNFVCIPFNKLINFLKYKGAEAGISVVTVEESYTSKSDHLVNEPMKHNDNYVGKRIMRGQFKSSTGKLINADINGAIGMLRKENVITDAQLFGLRDRGDVVSPKVLKINP